AAGGVPGCGQQLTVSVAVGHRQPGEPVGALETVVLDELAKLGVDTDHAQPRIELNAPILAAHAGDCLTHDKSPGARFHSFRLGTASSEWGPAVGGTSSGGTESWTLSDNSRFRQPLRPSAWKCRRWRRLLPGTSLNRCNRMK